MKVEDALKLAQAEQDALAEKEIAARGDAINAEMDDAAELKALDESQKAMASSLGEYNKAQYNNMGQIIGDIESEIGVAKAKDETARKRENAFRYISGLGDTLSSLANLVGTAHGAANQNQTYSSNAVVQKAEEARKARKLEMDNLNKRLDEMKAQQRELKAAGSLEEAKLKVAQENERAKLISAQRDRAEQEKRYADTQAYNALRDARADFVADRAFNAQQDQIKQTQENWQKNYNMQYAKFKDEQNSKNYNFTLANESIDIPKDKLNEVNVERIFQMLPDDIKKNIKGEQYTEIVPNEDPMFEPTRKTSYKAPSLAQKLAAIGAYADSNENIRNELKRLAPPKGKSGRDWSHREE